MSYYDRDCLGNQREKRVELAGGVVMTLRCTSEMRHFDPREYRPGEVWPGSPHHVEIVLNGSRIEFEWPEDSTNGN